MQMINKALKKSPAILSGLFLAFGFAYLPIALLGHSFAPAGTIPWNIGAAAIIIFLTAHGVRNMGEGVGTSAIPCLLPLFALFCAASKLIASDINIALYTAHSCIALACSLILLFSHKCSWKIKTGLGLAYAFPAMLLLALLFAKLFYSGMEVNALEDFSNMDIDAEKAFYAICALLGAALSFPATLMLWCGLGLPSLKKEDGKPSYAAVRKRLIAALPPLCAFSLIIWYFFIWYMLREFTESGSFHGRGLLSFAPGIIWCSGIFALGIWLPISLSAKLLDKHGSLTRGRWFLLALAFAALAIPSGNIASHAFFWLIGAF